MEKRTLLYPVHQELKAKMAAFAGWDMPIQYSDIAKEHLAVRLAAGLFDVSHMGELRVAGEAAFAFVEHLVTNRLSEPEAHRAVYSPLCQADGGTVDDLFVYIESKEDILLVVNAGNIEKDEAHIRKLLPPELTLTNESDEWLQVALQGPMATSILSDMHMFVDANVAGMKFMTWKSLILNGYPAILSKSGYTGSDGFEIYVRCENDAAWAADFWHKLLDAGQAYGILPVGLGARDTLRLEAGFPLYGHELSESISPIGANLLRFVRSEKEYFVGKAALVEETQTGTSRVRVGLALLDRGIVREGCAVYASANDSVSNVTGLETVVTGATCTEAMVSEAMVSELADIKTTEDTKGKTLIGAEPLAGNMVSELADIKATEDTKAKALIGAEPLAGNTGKQALDALTEDETNVKKIIGIVTSGGVGVFIGRNIAMASVEREYAAVGTILNAEVRGRMVKAEVVPLPFYRRPV